MKGETYNSKGPFFTNSYTFHKLFVLPYSSRHITCLLDKNGNFSEIFSGERLTFQFYSLTERVI